MIRRKLVVLERGDDPDMVIPGTYEFKNWFTYIWWRFMVWTEDTKVIRTDDVWVNNL